MDEFPLTREEKEKSVCSLYRQGKSIREISKAVHISFSDIGSIKRKYFGGDEAQEKQTWRLSKQGKGLKLFQEGKKSNLETAIELGLSATETIELQKQYRQLINDDNFSKVYEEIKNDIPIFVELYEKMKEEGLDSDKVVEAVESAEPLTFISYEKTKLSREVAALKEEVNILTQHKDALMQEVGALREEKNKLISPVRRRRLSSYQRNLQQQAYSTVELPFSNY